MRFPRGSILRESAGVVQGSEQFHQEQFGVLVATWVVPLADQPLEKLARVGEVEISRQKDGAVAPRAVIDQWLAGRQRVSAVGAVAQMPQIQFAEERMFQRGRLC